MIECEADQCGRDALVEVGFVKLCKSCAIGEVADWIINGPMKPVTLALKVIED